MTSATRALFLLTLCSACTTTTVGTMPTDSDRVIASPAPEPGGSVLPSETSDGSANASDSRPAPTPSSSPSPAPSPTPAPTTSPAPAPSPAPSTDPSTDPSPAPLPNDPTFVAAGASTFVSSGATLDLATPPGTQADDLFIALIDADEGAGPATVATPSGWTLLGGYPIHNLASAYPTWVIPSSENHGTWVFTRVAGASEATTTSFEFASTATARGVIVAYRGVDTNAPIHDKSGYAFYGSGYTNGYGSGNCTLSHGLQVNLVATAPTGHATYTVMQTDLDRSERFNSGEQPNGLNLVIHDEHLVGWGGGSTIFTGVAITNKQSPSGSNDAFLFSGTTLVLTPK